MNIYRYGTTVALLLIAGCALPEDTIDTHDPAADADEDTLRSGPPPLRPDVVCPGARLVGVLDNADLSCDLGGTVPPNWEWSTVFEDGSPGVAALGSSAPGELARYCFFERESPPMSAVDYEDMLDAIEASPGMQIGSVAADCRGEFPQADLNDPAVRDAMREAFHANIDRVDPPALLGGVSSGVEIAIVDTVSEVAIVDPTIDPVSDHGMQMTAIIADITCPGGATPCLDNLHHALAMPREDWLSSPDYDSGGMHGTQVDIALAIYEAVENWKIRKMLGGAPRLVINLSLGWERMLPFTFNEGRGPSQALISALEYASCEGALVLAAAGNNTDGECAADHTGVMAPALYETWAAPDAMQCFLAGYNNYAAPGYPIFSPGPRPLVYAVGAVDGLDVPTSVSREGGQPRLVATGINGIGQDPYDPGRIHDALTGTSVATAVASGAAGLIWRFRPALRPDEVVALLHSSGWATGVNADILGPGESPDVRRISVCAALDSACAGLPGPACPKPMCSASAPSLDADLSSYISEVDAVLASATIEDWTAPAANTISCAAPNWNNLAEPQPEIPVCPHCNVDVPPEEESTEPDDMLIMTIDPNYAGDIVGATLIVYDSSRNVSSYTLDSDTINSLNTNTTGVTTVVFDIPDTDSAMLEFQFTKGTQSNAIAVTH